MFVKLGEATSLFKMNTVVFITLFSAHYMTSSQQDSSKCATCQCIKLCKAHFASCASSFLMHTWWQDNMQ